ncbi:MAG: 23S rRNA methyltransferase [SAR116 cluster bacterium]|jgi:23S rRNA (uridine2552-2'-O)-methyltransferase|nr:23S rRNA methyltransferase [SAR116 cluster bacterium]|tara:strand:+ start:3341 stop:4042 length:702 start_codon:yes stop_codon:yes gene_type:complete
MNKKKVNLQKNKFVSSRSSKQKINKNKRTESSRKWISRQLNDPYVSEAQKRGFRSRSAFKLLQINEKFNLLKSGMSIIDLGCAPGGWLQVMSEEINKNSKGKIVGIDLLETDALPDVKILVGDINDQEIIDQVKIFFKGQKVNGVVSDMAADTTGHKPTDHIRTTMLLENAIEIAFDFLKKDGFFLGKCFKGGTEASVLNTLNNSFKTVKHVKPDASRKESVESYVLAMGFKQ